ncbi:hypothetical protein VA7868_02328 [Vibrio aerogenes CECT 7868]|uniref:Uncharacterized protein n=1 Tax=Vibrio aerogenes CECT 7868 TaxID=1216006 RepID=A0A1M5Z625_9VIBR|nr:hypothetical protein [Vibrio aerogenes]SHI19641.1 hypothetical protein VA7868_02328 [Vibrio aerogenes CECT 7868]
MLELIMGLFSSSGVGAIVGLVGSWLTRREERQNLEIKLSHEQEMFRLKQMQRTQQYNHELKMAEQGTESIKQQGKFAVEVAQTEAFETSQKTNMPLDNRFAELIRGLMRPFITLYLLVIATLIARHISGYMNEMTTLIDHQELTQIFRNTLEQVMFLTTTAVTWWFGSRPGHRNTGR